MIAFYKAYVPQICYVSPMRLLFVEHSVDTLFVHSGNKEPITAVSVMCITSRTLSTEIINFAGLYTSSHRFTGNLGRRDLVYIYSVSHTSLVWSSLSKAKSR